jgi:hypothetical protein
MPEHVGPGCAARRGTQGGVRLAAQAAKDGPLGACSTGGEGRIPQRLPRDLFHTALAKHDQVQMVPSTRAFSADGAAPRRMAGTVAGVVLFASGSVGRGEVEAGAGRPGTPRRPGRQAPEPTWPGQPPRGACSVAQRQHEAAQAGSSHGGREGYLHSTAEVRRSPVKDVSQEAGTLAAGRQEGRSCSPAGVRQGPRERSSRKAAVLAGA